MALIYYAFTDTNLFYSLFYLVLGILAIFSAIRYTVGNSLRLPWFGDLFVFVFGLVITLGVNFLYSKELDTILLCQQQLLVLLSVGVLNLNNMRDEASDKKVGKNTIVVK
jgi:1,4-dihydroxy-2-naphthoate octaprenyltransferase